VKKKAPPKNGWRLQLLLFLLTVVTTLIAGTSFYIAPGELLRDPSQILLGLPFSASILSILMAHEMGHYVTSRLYRVNVTLPYFIPAPTLIGTLGAVIKMRSPIGKKQILMEIGAAGPFMGMIVALPLVVWGLNHSEIIPMNTTSGEYIVFGDSLLFFLLTKLTVGTLPEGYDIMLHPVGFAGWVGFLVTALNLMPIGQLDGGHISYALFGRRHRIVSRLFVIFLVVLGAIAYPGWLVWALLVLIIGLDHPPVADDAVPLGTAHRILGYASLVLFVLTFIPQPVILDF
jgi:membrane-associated protease RseP (regulator of RpoE activity)